MLIFFFCFLCHSSCLNFREMVTVHWIDSGRRRKLKSISSRLTQEDGFFVHSSGLILPDKDFEFTFP